MRVGLMIAYWPWVSFEEQVALTDVAEEAGLDSVWIAEAWGQDAVSVLGYLAARTERVHFGTALMQVPARQATATAMTAATLDVITKGRFRLGIGVSGPQVSEGWYGMPFRRPLARTREYVDVIRQTIARDVVTNDGPEYPLPLTEEAGGGGLGKPLKLLITPHSESIPIYLGAIGPKATEMVGELADGWIPFMWDPDNPEVMLENVRVGLDKAGRSIDQLDISPIVPLAIHEDIGEARNLVRPLMAFYLGSMGHSSKNFYVETAERYGHGDSARACAELTAAGDRTGAAMALSDELLDACTIATTPAGLDDRLAAYEASGANTLVVFPFGDREATLRTLASASVPTHP